jgi:hypothetical protein
VRHTALTTAPLATSNAAISSTFDRRRFTAEC